jgi:hypothetical protein
MKLIAYLQRRYAWINLSGVSLIALLQRSPAARVAADVEEFVMVSPIGTLLKAAAAGVAALGAVDSMAGATTLASSITPNPTGTLPTLDATVNVAITPVAFTITNTINVGSWTITGNIPPGMKIVAQENTAISLTSAGNLDATTAGSTDPWSGMTTGANATTTPILEGTPTTAGTYTFDLQGFALGGEKGGSGQAGFTGTGISATFPYTVVVSSANMVTAPSFTTQPVSVSVTGGTVALNAVATSAATYQWWLNGTTMVAGATDPVLLLMDAAASAGSYTCVAANSAGSTTSSAAVVSITSTTNPGRLTNISCRAQVGTGGNVMIAGFVVGGGGTSGSQSVLVRGTGPTLGVAPFNIPGVLGDPELTLTNVSVSPSSVVTTNTGWGGNAAIKTAAASVGAFSWSSTSVDSAVFESLPAANYTAEIAGSSGDTGVALVEVYDATPAGTYTVTMPRLTNLSARVQVGTGANVVFAGFVVGGSSAKTVLIRASGPTLGVAPFNLSGTLPDPQLTLTNVGVTPNAVLTTNTVWSGSAEIKAVASSVGAFSWGLASHDSAILVTLPPGNYTAGVQGASSDTGIALIEVYEVD